LRNRIQLNYGTCMSIAADESALSHDAVAQAAVAASKPRWARILLAFLAEVIDKAVFPAAVLSERARLRLGVLFDWIDRQRHEAERSR